MKRDLVSLSILVSEATAKRLDRACRKAELENGGPVPRAQFVRQAIIRQLADMEASGATKDNVRSRGTASERGVANSAA